MASTSKKSPDRPADDALLLEVASELAARDQMMQLTLRPVSVFELAALIQLALRHPGVSDSVRKAGETFLIGARAYFAACPAVLEVIRRGDDPAHDRASS